MSLRGYVRKGKPALWTSAFPDQRENFTVKGGAGVALGPLSPKGRPKAPASLATAARRAAKARERRLYREEARAFVAGLVAAGARCPVFAAWDRLTPEARAMLTYCRAGRRKPDNISQVHHARGRVGRLLRDQRYWVGLSKWGHRAVHAFPAVARELGFLCALGDWNRPGPT